MRSAQLAEAELLLRALGGVLDAHLGDDRLGYVDGGVHPDFGSDRSHGDGREQVPFGHGYAELDPPIAADNRIGARESSRSPITLAPPACRKAAALADHRNLHIMEARVFDRHSEQDVFVIVISGSERVLVPDERVAPVAPAFRRLRNSPGELGYMFRDGGAQHRNAFLLLLR
jgi:hypothetical protein